MQDLIAIINDMWSMIWQVNAIWLKILTMPPFIFIPIVVFILINRRRFNIKGTIIASLMFLLPTLITLLIVLNFTLFLPMRMLFKRPNRRNIMIYNPYHNPFNPFDRW